MLTRGIEDGITIYTPSIAAVVSTVGITAIRTVASTPTATVVTATVAVSTTIITIVIDTMVDFVIVTTTLLPLLPARIKRSHCTPSSGSAVTPNKSRVSIRQLGVEGKTRDGRFCKKVTNRSSCNAHLELLKDTESDNE